jgi:hypothetical protein
MGITLANDNAQQLISVASVWTIEISEHAPGIITEIRATVDATLFEINFLSFRNWFQGMNETVKR